MTLFRSMIITTAICLAGTAWSQSPSNARTFSLETQKSMTKAMGYLSENKYSKAEKKLRDVLKIKNLSAYETSTVNQMLGQAAFRQDDYKDAIKYFERAAQAGGLLPRELTANELTIAQLYIKTKQYAAGASRMENWLRKTGSQEVKYLENAVQAYVQAEQYERALPWAERWFAMKSSKTRKHYDLMNFLYHNQGKTEKQLGILTAMTGQWPGERKLWDLQISALAAQDKTFEAYQVFAGLYDRQLLTTKEDLSKLVQYHEYYKRYDIAARVLETEMNNGRLDRGDANLAKLSQLKKQAGIAP